MNIWYDTVGTGEDVVVLHGWGMNANIWTPLLPYLQDNYRVTLIDLPGFGDSQHATLSANLDDNVAALLPILPPRCHLLGWSLGGLIATALALKAPSRFQTIATVASSPKFPQHGQWPGIPASLLQQFQQQLNQDFSKTIERFLAVQSMGSPHAKQQIKAVKEWIFAKPMANRESLENGLTLLQNADLRNALQHLELPFMRFYGRLDSLVPVSAEKHVGQLTLQSPSRVFDRCAHAPFISATEEFAHHYQQFLATA